MEKIKLEAIRRMEKGAMSARHGVILQVPAMRGGKTLRVAFEIWSKHDGVQCI